MKISLGLMGEHCAPFAIGDVIGLIALSIRFETAHRTPFCNSSVQSTQTHTSTQDSDPGSYKCTEVLSTFVQHLNYQAFLSIVVRDKDPITVIILPVEHRRSDLVFAISLLPITPSMCFATDLTGFRRFWFASGFERDEGLAGGAGEGLASGAGKSLASGVDESLACGVDESLACGVDENLAGGVGESLASGVDEGFASEKDEGFASETDEGLTSETDEGLASGVDEGLASGADKKLASGADEGLVSGADEVLASVVDIGSELAPALAVSAAGGMGEVGRRRDWARDISE
ncbi:hypothetical protein BC936DRAFT_142046 [Jimgerdemannia flammicorona]|uniref:Uncharacterized protein n=1 Tax=Jimgerdemannia flammicorona TaxID=994334 RepID=A0A433DFH7_9FUNG|nr:hypothetical protein BC936DRAFT_142046 [Jimgerdemannia flammicorona]